jgi:hypothetical protein
LFAIQPSPYLDHRFNDNTEMTSRQCIMAVPKIEANGIIPFGNLEGDVAMSKINLLHRASLVLFGPMLACTLARQTPQPAPTVEQLVFEIQTATPTVAPLAAFVEPPTSTPSPTITPTVALTATVAPTPTVAAETNEPAASVAAEAAPAAAAPSPPPPTATVPLSEPQRGGEWDFEAGFIPWPNPFGEPCPGSGLANGWGAFTTEDQYGSSCMNETTWKDNVYTGISAQEITFAYVGNQAGIFKSAPTIPGHRYTVEAYMRKESSPAPVEVSLGIDLTGGTDWQAPTVQWSAWDEDFDNQWSRAEETVTAAGESITIFIKGFHPYPEPGGALRIDSISVVDIGPE